MRLTRGWQVYGGLYVALVTTLTAVATVDTDHFVGWAWLTALALTVPTLLVLIPAIYLVVPIVWRLTDIDHGGPTWPTTVAYAVLFCVAATLNVLVVHRLVERRRARRALLPLPSPPAPSASATPVA